MTHMQPVPDASAPFVKRSEQPRPGYFALEAAGLQWLGEGPVHCAHVVDVDDRHLRLERLEPAPAQPEQARAFGRDLALTHDLGAPAFGAAPPVPADGESWSCPPPRDGWNRGWFGPLESPLSVPLEPVESWGEFYATQRLTPMIQLLRESRAPSSSVDVLETVTVGLQSGRYDDGDTPVRTHGDLWSGNLMFTHRGVVLIDPAAHGDHREQDLAFLHLFGAPLLEEIVTGYQSVHPLRTGWQDRVELHQLFVLAAHAVLFDPPGGGGYLRQTVQAARSALNLLNR